MVSATTSTQCMCAIHLLLGWQLQHVSTHRGPPSPEMSPVILMSAYRMHLDSLLQQAFAFLFSLLFLLTPLTFGEVLLFVNHFSHASILWNFTKVAISEILKLEQT